MTSITIPAVAITLQGLTPDLVRSCVIAEAAPTIPTPPVPDEGIAVLVPPTVTYENLPVVTPVDNSVTQMIGCIIDAFENPQGRLNALFPDAVAGDGVIERNTNDIWRYDGSLWINVSPDPGDTITLDAIIPPYNEIYSVVGRTRTRLNAESLAYALELLTEPDPIATRTSLRIIPTLPLVSFAFEAMVPAYAGQRTAVIQPPTVSASLATLAPEVNPPQPEVIFSMDGSDGATSLTSIDSNAIAATFHGNAQLDTAIKKYGTASLQLSGRATDDFIEFEAPSAIGSGDFTVEFWAYIPSSTSDYSVLVMFSDMYVVEFEPSTNQIVLYSDVGGAVNHTGATVTRDQFVHIAAYRIGSDYYLSVDGEVWTDSYSDSHVFTDTTHRIGDGDGTGAFACACHIDDYRLTLGTAVYGTTDFTPPVAPFS